MLWCGDISAFRISHAPVKWQGLELLFTRSKRTASCTINQQGNSAGLWRESSDPCSWQTWYPPGNLKMFASIALCSWEQSGSAEQRAQGVSLHCLKVINLCLTREKKSSESQCFSNVWIEGSNRPWRADAGEQELCFNPLSPGLTFNVKKEMDDGAESSFPAQEFGGCTVNFELEEMRGISGFAGGYLCNNSNCLWSQRDFGKIGFRNASLCWEGKGGWSRRETSAVE